MSRLERSTVLHNCQVFCSLSDREVQELETLATTTSYGTGEVICTQGERCDGLYAVVQGSVGLYRWVVRADAQGQEEFATDVLGPGEVFGWSSLIEPNINTFTARALGDTELKVLEGPDLKFMLEKNPVVGYQVMKKLAELVASGLHRAYALLDARS